ncbi:Uncharacterised protein [BD1-7 clade bacterium]|uniref:GST N-terminal domain-containing protein n=1 Tax=BD1-7 clade bacterium TaxID=2029982 RepID=A0A5S9QBW0_9GAMM|nr:Uncharacterised protein [BD1-7 clade bacterium]CAA0114946.1 Uncharacterised protein [BD1-7 clade bacterium]
MKLFLSATSPYARVVLSAAQFKGVSEKILLQWIDPWANSEELLEISALAQDPVFITEGSLTITESLCICQHLDRIGNEERLYGWGSERAPMLNRLGFVKGMLDKAYQLAMYQKFHGQQLDPLAQRARDALIRIQPHVKQYLRERSADKPTDLADIVFVAALEYMELQLGDLPVVKSLAEIDSFQQLQQTPCMVKTKIPVLQAMEQNNINQL